MMQSNISYDKTLQTAMEYIANNWNDDFSVADLAKKCCVSESTLFDPIAFVGVRDQHQGAEVFLVAQKYGLQDQFSFFLIQYDPELMGVVVGQGRTVVTKNHGSIVLTFA